MRTYTVRRGDSLFSIARKFYGDGEKYAQLASYNGLTNPNVLEVGQVLRIPDLTELDNLLGTWHNYKNGSIWWRVTPEGVEIKGKGYVKNSSFTKRAEEIWQHHREPIVAALKKYRVPVPVIIATISTESSGNSRAYRYEPAFYDNYIKNKKLWKNNPYYNEPKRISASYGLMQILYTTAYDVGFRGKPEDLYDPETNIDAGAAYIASSFQVKNHGWDPPKIACAYNAGSVRPTNKNSWGMFFHPGHLNRWIPSYNGAVEVIGEAEFPESPPEPIEVEQPQPPVVVSPEEDEDQLTKVRVRFLFPKQAGKTWQTLIVDMFKHNKNGIGDPVSFKITSPYTTPDGSSLYDLPNVTTGVYDFVFTDAVSSSVIYDLAEVVAKKNPTVVDLHDESDLTQEVPSEEVFPEEVPIPEKSTATVRIRFSKISGQAWKPVIIDMFKHEADGVGDPVSYTVKIPSTDQGGNISMIFLMFQKVCTILCLRMPRLNLFSMILPTMASIKRLS